MTRFFNPLLLVTLLISGPVPVFGQEEFLDDFGSLLARIGYEADLAVQAAPEIEEIETLSTFIRNVDDALEAAPDLMPLINQAISGSDTLRVMYAEPEWLHGIDLYSAGGRPELPGDARAQDASAQTTIWVVGWSGLVLRSDDNGASWARQDAGTSENLMAVDFVGDSFGIAVGENGTILRTTDGGAVWDAHGTRAGELHRAVDCVDAMNCWVVGDYDRVYHSADGGLSWQAQGRPAGLGRLDAVRMLSARVGVGGGPGAIWRTTDGGKSWTRVHSFRRVMMFSDEPVVTSIDTADGVNLWAVGRAAGDLAILKSTDAGKTWTSQTGAIRAKDYLTFQEQRQAAAHRATAVSAVSGDQAHVVGTNGVILATTDGGENWWLQLATSNPNDSLHALVMRDGGVGWAAGNFGQIVATNRGGLTWVTQRGPFHEMYTIAAGILGVEIGAASVFELRRLRLEERFDEALDLSARLLSAHPDDGEVVREGSLLHYRVAAAASDEGRIAEAIAHYGQAIALRDGDYPAALNNRALLHAKQGRFDLALADIEDAVRIAPENSLYMANRCLVHRLTGDLAQALADCDAAVALGLPSHAGNRSWVMLQRGLVRRMTGGLDGAVEDFIAAVSDARPETIEHIQKLMTAAGLYDGAIDGNMGEELATAVELCVRDDACFAQASGQMIDIVDFMR